jgi:hypothetical protein
LKKIFNSTLGKLYDLLTYKCFTIFKKIIFNEYWIGDQNEPPENPAYGLEITPERRMYLKDLNIDIINFNIKSVFLI